MGVCGVFERHAEGRKEERVAPPRPQRRKESRGSQTEHGFHPNKRVRCSFLVFRGGSEKQLCLTLVSQTLNNQAHDSIECLKT